MLLIFKLLSLTKAIQVINIISQIKTENNINEILLVNPLKPMWPTENIIIEINAIQINFTITLLTHESWMNNSGVTPIEHSLVIFTIDKVDQIELMMTHHHTKPKCVYGSEKLLFIFVQFKPSNVQL